MNTREKAVTVVDELVAATKDTSVRRILVRGDLSDAPTVRLSPGQCLRGDGDRSGITFSEQADGLQLSSDNRIHNIHLHASPDKRAIFNDTTVENLGRIELAGVVAIGQVQILTRDKVLGGHIISADARSQDDRPNGFGVNVIQGALTLWNMQPEESAVISGGIKANGSGVPPIEQHGAIESLRIAGGCVAAGGGSAKI